MQEIIQWLNNNSNQDFSNFRLLEVEYYENFNKTIFKFHYNGETFVDESKKELKNLLTKYLHNQTEVQIKLKQYYLDASVLSAYVMEFIKNSFNGIYTLFDEARIKIVRNDEKFSVEIYCDKAQLEYLIENSFIEKINAYFKDILFNEIVCEIKEYVEIEKKSDNEIVYKFVKPEPYISLKQDNLFDVSEEDNDYLKSNKFVVFDLETTGLFFTQHEIIEIGAVKIENGKITETFSTLIKPESKISEEITNITGITNDMVKDAPNFQNVLNDFYEFCKDCVLVGYNILEFDIKFLNFHANKYGVEFSHKIEDALLMARKYCPGLKRYKLKDVSNNLGVVLENAHRALNDTLATAEVFIKLSKFI